MPVLEIQGDLCQRFQTCYLPISATLYSVLHRLERQGCVISRMVEVNAELRGGNRCKVYRLASPPNPVASSPATSSNVIVPVLLSPAFLLSFLF